MSAPSDDKILIGTRRYHTVLATLLHWITVTIIMAPSHQRWRQNMRKPRDFDSELKSLADKAKQLKERSEAHTSELQSLMRISYAVFCLKKKKITKNEQQTKPQKIT